MCDSGSSKAIIQKYGVSSTLASLLFIIDFYDAKTARLRVPNPRFDIGIEAEAFCLI